MIYNAEGDMGYQQAAIGYKEYFWKGTFAFTQNK